jgi:hypothetical protein
LDDWLAQVSQFMSVVRVTRCGFLLQNSVEAEVEQFDSAE